MGCYPLFSCVNWSGLSEDIAKLDQYLVSLTIVADPFGQYQTEELHQCFPDLMKPFKEHLVVDLHRPLSSFVSSHHQAQTKRALQSVHVERCNDPAEHANEWIDLYRNLKTRHDMKGFSAFSAKSLAEQLLVPGLVMFRGAEKDHTVGMALWYRQGAVAYYHLAASSNRGYEVEASFALVWAALEHFSAEGLDWADLGAGAGVRNDAKDGLTLFKRGWSTGSRPVYLCGRILQRDTYKSLSRQMGGRHTHYFPAYRAGELD
jgi:hypothetical protein